VALLKGGMSEAIDRPPDLVRVIRQVGLRSRRQRSSAKCKLDSV